MEIPFSNLFSATSKADWLAQVNKELKDDNAYETLRWRTPEGFVLEPYYVSSDLHTLPLATQQSAQKQTPGWLNTPSSTLTNQPADNALLRELLARGADALLLQPNAATDIARLLNGIKLSDTPIFFRFDTPDADLPARMQDLLNVAPYQLKGGLLNTVGSTTAELTRLLADSPQFRTICCSSHTYHNAGATAVQEIAFTLGALTDAYDTLTEQGLSIDLLATKTMLSVSVGTSYFTEIAKLRALRVLLHRLFGYYQLSTVYQPFIHTQTSTFYDAVATPYTNLLRGTTEAMAAVIGGADALTVHAYDVVFETPTEFSERIARNLSLLLREESNLDKVADPASGSYYIETLTHQLAEAAWTLFLDVEQRGGLAKATADGFIQTELNTAYRARQEAIEQGNVLVGVTKFRSDEGPATPAPLPSTPHNPFPSHRLAEAFE